MERGKAERDRVPGKSAVLETANDLIQWNLYYPAVLDPSDLRWTAAEKAAITDSLAAYSSGDLIRAVDLYDWKRTSISPAEAAYQAALLLSVGQVDKAQLLLRKQGEDAPRSLTRLIMAVKATLQPEWPKPRSASEWLAESYYQQSRHQLESARVAARAAVTNASDFGFAWARLAEMEFSFGRREETAKALARALSLSPRNAQALALQGFILAAQGQNRAAMAQFDRAIEAEASLGNGWLGRGLCSFRVARSAEGLQDLLVAASLEPQRGLLRSYLGKAFAQTGDNSHAAQELRLAKELDPQDPPPGSIPPWCIKNGTRSTRPFEISGNHKP